jgi:hypothetical protein
MNRAKAPAVYDHQYLHSRGATMELGLKIGHDFADLLAITATLGILITLCNMDNIETKSTINHKRI